MCDVHPFVRETEGLRFLPSTSLSRTTTHTSGITRHIHPLPRTSNPPPTTAAGAICQKAFRGGGTQSGRAPCHELASGGSCGGWGLLLRSGVDEVAAAREGKGGLSGLSRRRAEEEEGCVVLPPVAGRCCLCWWLDCYGVCDRGLSVRVKSLSAHPAHNHPTHIHIITCCCCCCCCWCWRAMIMDWATSAWLVFSLLCFCLFAHVVGIRSIMLVFMGAVRC